MTWSNWMNIFRANSLKGVIAFGMTMVIIAGLIDLSVGSTVALSGVIVARACRDFTAGGMDLTTCLSSSELRFPSYWLLRSAIMHGFFAHKAGMPPFIVTLVSYNALYGLAGMVSEGFPIANQYPEWFNVLGGGRINIPAWFSNLFGVGRDRWHPIPRSCTADYFPDRFLYHGIYKDRPGNLRDRRQSRICTFERHQCLQNKGDLFYCRSNNGCSFRFYGLRPGFGRIIQFWQGLGAGCDQCGDHWRHQF